MHDCFISYSHKDSHIAISVQSIFEKNEIRCWIDFRDAIPGTDYAASIVHAIKAADVFILILSENSIQSKHVLNEINSAVSAEDPPTIIPLKVDNGKLNESMQYYLGRTHWMDALTPPLENHISQLAEKVKIYLKTKPKSFEPSAPSTASASASSSPSATQSLTDCKMLKYQDLVALGYSAKQIALKLVENDYINCNGIGLENEGEAQQWEEYLQNDSDTFQYLINAKNEIVGDWSIVALTDEVFDSAIRGELLENDIDLDKTEMLCFPGSYNGYILTFSILPEYRNMKNYNLIIDSFLRQLECYAENGIFFKRWCINVFGKEVEAMVKQLGFKYLTNNKVCGKIFFCDFSTLPNIPIYKKYEKLVNYYSNAER